MYYLTWYFVCGVWYQRSAFGVDVGLTILRSDETEFRPY